MGNPGGSVKFENESISVTVEHQAWQAIVLAVDKAIAGGVFFFKRGTHVGGDDKFVLKPIRVDDGGVTRLQDTHTDRGRGVIQTNREKAALAIEDDGEIAGGALVALLTDGLIEYPGMSLPQSTFCRRVDSQCNSFCRRAWE